MSTVDPTLRNWSNKHTLLDARSHHGPALLFTNGRLFIAWTGSDDRLNIMSSSDLGASWKNKRTSSTLTGMDPPVLTFSAPPSAQTRRTAQVEPRSARGAAYRGADDNSHGQRRVRGETCGPAWVNREGGLCWWR